MTPRAKVVAVAAMLGGLLVGVIVWIAVRRPPDPPASFVVKSTGRTVSVVGVTHGTNHVRGHWLGKLTRRTPRIAAGLERVLGTSLSVQQRSTGVPSVMLWLEPEAAAVPATPGSYMAYLADENGFLSGPEATALLWNAESVSFAAVPRRMRELDVRFFERRPNGSVEPVAQVRVPNPWFARSAEAAPPPPLPQTQLHGTLEATIETFTTGHDRTSRSASLPGGGVQMVWGVNPRGGDVRSVIGGRFLTQGRPMERWVIASAWMEDVTGNRLQCRGLGWSGVNEQRWFTLSPSLWPSEKAWTLELLLKRDAGFPSNEMFQVNALLLPQVGATGQYHFRTHFNGVGLTVESIVRKAPLSRDEWSSTDLSHVRLTHTPLPPNVYLDLIYARVGTEERNLTCPSWSHSDPGDRSYQIQDIPADATTLHLAFAVQSGRRVVFEVQPAIGRAEAH